MNTSLQRLLHYKADNARWSAEIIIFSFIANISSLIDVLRPNASFRPIRYFFPSL